MTLSDIIENARQLAFDVDPGAARSWSDTQYVNAAQDARRFLARERPEVYTNNLKQFVVPASLSLETASDDMLEDDIYWNYFVAFLASRYFRSNSWDTASRQQADDLYKEALRSVGLSSR